MFRNQVGKRPEESKATEESKDRSLESEMSWEGTTSEGTGGTMVPGSISWWFQGKGKEGSS